MRDTTFREAGVTHHGSLRNPFQRDVPKDAPVEPGLLEQLDERLQRWKGELNTALDAPPVPPNESGTYVAMTVKAIEKPESHMVGGPVLWGTGGSIAFERVEQKVYDPKRLSGLPGLTPDLLNSLRERDSVCYRRGESMNFELLGRIPRDHTPRLVDRLIILEGMTPPDIKQTLPSKDP